MSQARRWPLHPQPAELESMSSWLERTAGLYRMSVRELLEDEIGHTRAAAPAVIDHVLPAATLQVLAERTGADPAQLRMMTFAGWAPWLMDELSMHPDDAQETFDTYVRANSVLLAPGDAGGNKAAAYQGWDGPWWPKHPVNRRCPACAADGDPRRALLWRLPITVACQRHGCRLDDADRIALALALGERPQATPVDEPLAALDRYTYQGMTTGTVALSGRTVHVGVWFRLLRALLDEVSLALTTRSSHGRATLERVWQETGLPERGGLRVWRPYELLDWPMQQAMLRAAATALALAAGGRITPRGVLGPALVPAGHRQVYEGDRAAWEWKRTTAELDAMVATACAGDPHAARVLLSLCTFASRTYADFYRQQRYLVDLGIPQDILPDHTGLGRTDLRL